MRPDSNINSSLRSGFTLIELLVTISIVALLIALLIPAVQYSREAARKLNCSSNLHQLGVALNNYQSTVGALPLANNGARGYSVHSMILPNLEQSQLYNSINFSLFFIDGANNTAIRTNLTVLNCPSDAYSFRSAGWTSYACNTGHSYQLSNKYNGAFVLSPDLSSSAGITDGTSSTVAMAEWVQGSGLLNKVNDRLGTISRSEPMLLSPSQFDQAVSNCVNQFNVDNKELVYVKGMIWLHTGVGATLYNHNITPNGLSCFNGDYAQQGSLTSSSRHSGGANVLFVDGHVSFLRDSISLPIWRALGTRSGAEVISEQY